MKSVDVLCGIDGVEDALLGVRPHSWGNGDWTRMPSIPVVGIEPCDQRQRVVQRRRVVETEQLGPATRVAHRLILLRT